MAARMGYICWTSPARCDIATVLTVAMWHHLRVVLSTRTDHDALARILERQLDVITRQQALAGNMTSHALQHRIRPGGPWRTVLPGVYIAATGTPTIAQQEMAAMLYHPTARQRLVQELVAHVVDAGQAGIVLDFEQVPDKSQRDFRSFVGELEAGLHGADLKLMVALPAADWAYDYAAVSRECDAIVLMNYDDHWLTSAPGPIAPQDWFVTNIEKMLKLVPREKIVMGIANYAYDWPDAKGRAAHEVASPQTFEEAIVTSSESEAPVEYDTDSLNPHYSYYDEHDHVRHPGPPRWVQSPHEQHPAGQERA